MEALIVLWAVLTVTLLAVCNRLLGENKILKQQIRYFTGDKALKPPV